MGKILLVEDDPVLGKGVKVNLELENNDVTWVQNLASAMSAVNEQKFDLAILDLGLPDGNGLTLCQSTRAAGSRMPIIILTAQTDEDSVVAGLNAGANDYVRKPFGNRELLARVKNLMKEPGERKDEIRYGDVIIHRDQRSVYFDTTLIDFNRREFDIFTFLVDNHESVVTRERLLDYLDKEGEILDRTLDSHVSHIRAKLRKAGAGSVQISSVYGVGYRLEKT